MARYGTAITRWLVLAAILLAPVTAFAADWDRFPELPGWQNVAIKKLYDGPRYNDLKRCYRRFDSRVGADYFGALVGVTARSGSESREHSDARPYVDALYESWKEKSRVEPDTHILIAVGISNRSVGIHPGTKWQKIGFRGDVIDETIEISKVHENLARSDYIAAMCDLANAVDLQLASLQQKMKQRVAQFQQESKSVEQKVTNLQNRLEEKFDEGHPFGDKLSGEVSDARQNIEEAREKVNDEPAAAVNELDDARGVIADVRQKLDAYDQKIGALGNVEQTLASLKTEIEQRPDLDWEGPQEALETLERCRKKAESIRRTFEGAPADVRDCRRQAETRLARADAQYYYRRTVIPAILLLILAALAVWFVVARLLRRRRAVDKVEPALATWQERLERARERLEGLETDYPMFLTPRESSWEDESEETAYRASEAVIRAHLLARKGQELFAEARDIFDSSHFFDVSGPEEAWRLLHETQFEFSRGSRDPLGRLPETTRSSFTSTASQLLGELDAAYWEAINRLDAVVEVRDRCDEAWNRAGAAASRAMAAVEGRESIGLPLEPVAASFGESIVSWQKACRVSQRDPRRATGLLEEASEQLTSLAEQLEQGNEAIERIRGGVGETGKAIRTKSRRNRFSGGGPKESGFTPESGLEETARLARRVVQMVARGDDRRAGESVDALETKLQGVADQVETYEGASEEIPQRLEQLDSRRQSLQNDARNLQGRLRQLASKEGEAAFELEKTQLRQVLSTLSRIAKQIDRVERDHREGRYLVAASALAAIRDVLDAAGDFLAQFDQLEQRVEAARTESKSLEAECEQLVQTLEACRQKPGGAEALDDLAAETIDAFRSLQSRAGEGRVNALAYGSALVSVRDDLAFLEDEFQADLSAYESSRELYERLRSRTSGLQESAARGGPGLQSLEARLSNWAENVEHPSVGGRALLMEGQVVARSVRRAEYLRADGCGPARAVRSRLAYARRQLESLTSRSFGGAGQVEFEDIGGRLEQSQRTLQSGDPASALQTVEEAICDMELRAARAKARAEEGFRRCYVRNVDAPKATYDLSLFADFDDDIDWGQVPSVGVPASRRWGGE